MAAHMCAACGRFSDPGQGQGSVIHTSPDRTQCFCIDPDLAGPEMGPGPGGPGTQVGQVVRGQEGQGVRWTRGQVGQVVRWARVQAGQGDRWARSQGNRY